MREALTNIISPLENKGPWRSGVISWDWTLILNGFIPSAMEKKDLLIPVTVKTRGAKIEELIFWFLRNNQ
jgi:hypothetical protein